MSLLRYQDGSTGNPQPLRNQQTVKCPKKPFFANSFRPHLLGLACAGLALSLGAAAQPDETWDWVPLEQLTEEQQMQVGAACRGAYIDPLADAENLGLDPSLAPLWVEADFSEMVGQKITLSGQVEVQQGPRFLAAEDMRFDLESEQASLEGGVEIRQPGMLVRGTGARVDMAGNYARFDGGKFVLHESHLHGSAGSIEQRADGVVVLKNGQLTSCEPGQEAWQLRGAQLRVNPETRQGSGRHVVVDVAGVPVFYLPYITFPVGSERMTGWLFPLLGRSQSGADITLPWYWNIAPNYDATLSPRYVAGHGAMLETEFRYLNSFSNNQLNLAFLPNDSGGGDPDVDRLIEEGFDEDLLRPNRDQDRWLVQIAHTGTGDRPWYTDIEYTRVSDLEYFRDFSGASFDDSNNTFVSQGASFGYQLPNWHLHTRVQAYQNLLADIVPSYRQLPRISADGAYQWGALGLSLRHNYVHFDHPNDNFISGQRVNLDYQLQWNQQWTWGFVRPAVGLQGLAYRLDEDTLLEGTNPTPHLAAPSFSMDTGLVFERHGGRQTLEPRLFYLYRHDVDHSDLYQVGQSLPGHSGDVNFDTTPLTFGYHHLFRDRRFSGGDRIGDANQVTLGATSRWFAPDASTELLSISLGQVFYFSDRTVTLSGSSEAQTGRESNLASQITAQVTPRTRLRSDFLYNAQNDRIMRATAGVHYRSDHQRILNMTYRYVRADELEQSTLPVDQLDTSFMWPVGRQWQFMGRLFYDLEENKELDAFLGFEYDDCCYRLRVLARRWLDSKLADLVDDERRHYDNGIFLEIDLKGLASSGERIQRLLENSISGMRNY